MDEGFIAQARASTFQEVRDGVCAAAQYAATFFNVRWKNGKIAKNLSPSQKRKWTFMKKKGGKEASYGVVSSSMQISAHEMRKKQQQDEDTRPHWLRENFKHKLGRCGFGRARDGEKSGSKWRGFH